MMIEIWIKTGMSHGVMNSDASDRLGQLLENFSLHQLRLIHCGESIK
jgi:hypothetical protein